PRPLLLFRAMGRTHMPSQWETMRKSAVTLPALEGLATRSLDDATCRSRRRFDIPQRPQLVANAAKQLAHPRHQLPLPLRELLFLPLQRLPFLYQRAKRLDERIGHES